MVSEHRVDFDCSWSTLFNLKENEKQSLILSCKAWEGKYEPEYLARLLGFDNLRANEAYIKACETEALSFCLKDSDFARDVLSDGEYEKALNMFDRKQYSGKLLKDLLSKFIRALESCKNKDGIRNYLERDIRRTAKAISDCLAEKSFAPLKKVIEKIASGVKSDCYFVAEKEDYVAQERETRVLLNKFLFEDYGIKGEPVNVYNSGETLNELIYKKALLDDDEFWKEHSKFRISAFTDAIYEYNDEKHAQKVWKYIIDKIKGNEIGAKLLEKNLPVKYLFENRIFDSLKERLFKIFSRFECVYDLDKIRDEACCYPHTKCENAEEKIACGKVLTDGFFKAVYPADSRKAIDFFNGQINGEEPFYVNDFTSVKDLFYGYTSRLWFDDAERAAVLVYCPEYFSAENIWNRIYLIAYAANKLESNIDKCYANLFEMFYSLFRAVERKLGLKTTFQKDNDSREKAYAGLKGILNKYGVEISDKHKNDYITSLLDRKVADAEEMERFPALEQLGDAVYGFAVAEMMFYQPTDYEPDSIFKDYDNYVCANAQVEICRKTGLDKLYISPLTLSYKQSENTGHDKAFSVIGQESDSKDCKLKFLADSLEMVIGTICNDLGYAAAIEFSKRIVKEQFPDIFKKEVRWENRYDEDHDPEIDWEYWNRIKPAPTPIFDDFSSQNYLEEMWRALHKFMLAYSIGTGTKEVREFLTHRYVNLESGDELYGVKNLRYSRFNSAMYDYLHNGLAQFIETYSVKIRENYKNSKYNKF